MRKKIKINFTSFKIKINLAILFAFLGFRLIPILAIVGVVLSIFNFIKMPVPDIFLCCLGAMATSIVVSLWLNDNVIEVLEI